VEERGVRINIEVTPVLRGCVYEPETRAVSPKVEDQFGFAEIKVVSFADLYGGKLVDALDRQRPRDLFDVRDLLSNEGIDATLRKAFAFYILSHNPPDGRSPGTCPPGCSAGIHAGLCRHDG
jgi:predicted nucleotidyltransferase component of viral defense system